MTVASSVAAPTPLRLGTVARIAAVVYAAAWTLGLLIAPAAPGLDATAAELRTHFTTNASAAATQSWLVHGVAGAALLICIVAVARALPAGHRRVVRVAGPAAVAVSFAQVAFLQLLVGDLDGEPSSVVTWFTAVNRADSVKLLLLGVVVAAVTSAGRRQRAFPRWVVALGAVLAPLLPVSGAAFVLESTTLYTLLYLSLPLLIVWVVASTVASTRREAAPAAASR